MVFETITRYLDWQLISFIVLFVYALNFACMPGNVFNPGFKKRIKKQKSPYRNMEIAADETGTKWEYKMPDGSEEVDIIEYPIDKALKKFINQYWSKPLIKCPICMCSFWGSVIYLTFSPHYSVVQWAVTVIAAAGLARLLKSFSQ